MADDSAKRNNLQKTTGGQSKNQGGASRSDKLRIALLRLAQTLQFSLHPDSVDDYLNNLLDLSDEQLTVAFTRAMRECEFFPRIAKLRELAGSAPAQQKQVESVEAQAAWNEVQRYISKHGVERLPVHVRSKGEPGKPGYVPSHQAPPPPLPARIEYALRRIGGLQALRGGDMDTAFPFLLRDFTAGFNEYPLTEEAKHPALPAAAKPALVGEVTEQTGPPVGFGDVMKKVVEMSESKGMPEHERKLQQAREGPRRVSPPIQLTKEQIEARRPAEQAECERVRKAMEDAS